MRSCEWLFMVPFLLKDSLAPFVKRKRYEQIVMDFQFQNTNVNVQSHGLSKITALLSTNHMRDDKNVIQLAFRIVNS